jgi:hypothetical protein
MKRKIYYQAFHRKKNFLNDDYDDLIFETVIDWEDLPPVDSERAADAEAYRRFDAMFAQSNMEKTYLHSDIDIRFVAHDLTPIKLAEQTKDDDDYYLPLETENGKLVIMRFPRVGTYGHPKDDACEVLTDWGINLVTKGHYS